VKAQNLSVSLKNRSFSQQLFAIDFLKKHDSLYYAQNNKWEPFASSAAIDSFIDQYEQAWKSSVNTDDPNCLRIDSYVFGLIERSKHAGDWSESYVWNKYMVPSFLSDFAFCLTNPNSDKTPFLWPGNAENIFAYALNYDLPSEEWGQLSMAYSQMPALLDKYISFKTQLDSNQFKSLISTKTGILHFKTFYSVSDALCADQLDEAFAVLATGFSQQQNPIKYLSRLVQKLASRYAQAGKRDRALAVLDITVRSTNNSDMSRDSLRTWYQTFDPLNGLNRFESISNETTSPILVPSGKRIQLSGCYIDLVTGRPLDLSSLTGKTVLLDFWTTWCGPCIAEIPNLNAFVKRFSDREDFVFISISSDALEGGATESFVQEFAAKKKIKYMVIYDKPDSSLTRQFAVYGWPSKYVVSANGEILQRADKVSEIDLKAVEEFLKRK